MVFVVEKMHVIPSRADGEEPLARFIAFATEEASDVSGFGVVRESESLRRRGPSARCASLGMTCRSEPLFQQSRNLLIR
jgi:hypothetical protein